MIINKLFMKIYITVFTAAFLYQANVKAADTLASHSKFIAIGSEYQHSDNISKTASGEKSGASILANIELGYAQQSENNGITLNYSAEYRDQIKNEVEDSNYWAGKSKITQNLFSKNLRLSLEHNRQRYIIDQKKANLAANQSERDRLDLGLQWFIPYSRRTMFVLGGAHEEIWFQNDGSVNSNSNSGQASWQYALNQKVQLQLGYFGSENNFDNVDNVDNDYQEHNLDAKITSQYRLGTYSLNIGKNWIQGSDSDYHGLNYGLSIDALIRRHLLQLNLSREITNSSQQIGESNELDFTKNSLFRRTSVSLDHQYTVIEQRLVSNVRLYFDNDSDISSTESVTNKDRNRYGVYTQLSWSITEKLISSISVDYYDRDISGGEQSKYREAEIYGRYNINNSLYIQLTAAFEKQIFAQSNSGYEEQRYSTKIAFRY